MPGSVLSTGEATANKTGKDSDPRRAYLVMGGMQEEIITKTKEQITLCVTR